jgi:hypothetical protein
MPRIVEIAAVIGSDGRRGARVRFEARRWQRLHLDAYSYPP